MPVFDWTRRPTKHFGMVWVPIAEIELQDSQERFRKFAVQIDSGATISLLRKSAAEFLGINRETGQPVELTSVGGATTVAFVHSIKLRLAGMPIQPVPFAIADSEAVPVLLGRLGFFDRLQVDFDASLSHTRVTGVWLPDEWPNFWKLMLVIEDRILTRMLEAPASQDFKSALSSFVRRGGELMAAAAGLAKLGRQFAGPLVMRSMFDLAAQFEWLMRDPDVRSTQYLEFATLAKNRWQKGIVEKPGGEIGQDLAASPDRPAAEARLRSESAPLAKNYQRNGRNSPNWYCKSILKLCEEIGWDAEYKLWYAEWSAWAHADPMSTEWSRSLPEFKSSGRELLLHCFRYYARVLKLIADKKRIVLSDEQYEFLAKLAGPYA